jgi:hypothetical protein
MGHEHFFPAYQCSLTFQLKCVVFQLKCVLLSTSHFEAIKEIERNIMVKIKLITCCAACCGNGSASLTIDLFAFEAHPTRIAQHSLNVGHNRGRGPAA